MTNQSRACADKMSGQKCAACSDKVPPVKKPRVSMKMVQKWITESDREMSMSAWFQYEKADAEVLYVHSVQREAARHAQLQPCVCS